MYDEVTEDQYKSVVAGRLAKDDFVVDDGVEGYMDNGMDDFEERDASEDEEDARRSRKGEHISMHRISECIYNII